MSTGQRFVVKLHPATSPSKVAYLGGNGCQGFNVEHEIDAHRFEDRYEAERFASHFRGWWRGFGGFDPQHISVVEVSGRDPDSTDLEDAALANLPHDA